MISVILPIYKEKLNWVRESIDSILCQTYDNFELLLVNDNPENEDNINIILEYERKDSRVVGILHEENMGLAKSLNQAVRLAKGDLIARMDSDDISMPTRFEEQIRYLENNPDVGVIGAFGITIDESGAVCYRMNMYEKDEFLKGLTLFYTPFIHPAVIIRKRILEENPYDEHCRIGQDRELWCRLKDKTTFYNIPKILIKYRISSFQAPQKAGRNRSQESINYLGNKILCYWKIDLKYLNIYNSISRGCVPEINEINKFFLYLLKDIKGLHNRYFIIKKYTECILRISRVHVIANQIMYKYPLEYLASNIYSLGRLTRKHIYLK